MLFWVSWLYLCMRLWLIFSHHVIILNLQEIFSSEINFRRLCGCKQKRHVCFVSVRVFSVFFVVVVRFRCKDKYVYILCKWRPGLFVYSSSSFSSLAYVSLSVCVCVWVWVRNFSFTHLATETIILHVSHEHNDFGNQIK